MQMTRCVILLSPPPGGWALTTTPISLPGRGQFCSRPANALTGSKPAASVSATACVRRRRN